MSALSIKSEDVTAFQALFPGYSQAHGIFEINGLDPLTKKKKGRPRLKDVRHRLPPGNSI
jgi:hypothetical protein